MEERLFSVRRKQERFCVCLTEKNVVLLRLYTTNAFFYIGLVRDFDWLNSWPPCYLIHSVEYTRRKYSARSLDETFSRMLEDLLSGVLSGIIDDPAWTAGRTTSYSTFTAECLTQMEHKRATEQERATKNDGCRQSHCWTPFTDRAKHQIDWDSATCITYFTGYYQRLTNQSCLTNLRQTPLNRSQHLPSLTNGLQSAKLITIEWMANRQFDLKINDNCNFGKTRIETHKSHLEPS